MLNYINQPEVIQIEKKSSTTFLFLDCCLISW